ncbi:hypothetical protein P3S68_014197 [Capsicum galapagoense]
MGVFCSILVALLVVLDLLAALVVSILVILLVVFILLLVLDLRGVLVGRITMGVFYSILVVLLVVLDMLVVLVMSILVVLIILLNNNMNQGRGTGRGIIGHVGKSAARSDIPVLTANMPTIPTPTVAPQIAGGVGAPTSNHGSTSPTARNQSNPIAVGMSSQTNQVGEDVSRSNTNGERWQPSKACSNSIHKSFKSELDHNGFHWKGVSCDIKDGYFGEFKKHFYWDSSISDVALKKQWQIKATIVYRNFISKIKEKGIRQDFIPEDVWESWQRLWADPKCIEK